MPHVVGLGINVGGRQLGSSSSLSVVRKEVLDLASSDIARHEFELPQSSRRSLRRRHGATWSRSRNRVLRNSRASAEPSLPLPDLSPRPVHPVYHSTTYLPLSSPVSSPAPSLTPPSTLHFRTDSYDRANNENGPFFGLAVGLSVLCGVLVLGLSGSGIFAYYSRRKQNRRLAKAKKEKDREARASFESRGGIGDRGKAMFYPTDRRSEWLRQGLESPHLVLPEKAKSRNLCSSKPASPLAYHKGKFGPKLVSRLDVDEKTPHTKPKDLTVPETRARHTFSPAMPSPLGNRPVWTAPGSVSRGVNIDLGSESGASELDTSLLNFRKLVTLSASSPSSSPSIDNTTSGDQRPITTLSVSEHSNAVGHIIHLAKETRDGQTQTQHATSETTTNSLSSVETSNSSPTISSLDSLSAETHVTGMSSLSNDHPTDETLLHEDVPWIAPIYAQGCIEDSFGTLFVPLAPSSSSSGQVLSIDDSHLSSLVDSDNVQPSLKPSVSLPVPLAPSSPSIASSTNFIFPSSTDSTFLSMHMMLLKDAPLPPPTIMVSTPTNASLRTRALAAFQMGSLLVDAWDDGSEDEDEGDEGGISGDPRVDGEFERWEWARRGLASTVLHSQPSVRAPLPTLTMESPHTSVLVPIRNLPPNKVSNPKARAMKSDKENTMPQCSLHNRSVSDSFAARSIPSIVNASAFHRPTSIPVLSSLRISRLLRRGDQTAQVQAGGENDIL